MRLHGNLCFKGLQNSPPPLIFRQLQERIAPCDEALWRMSLGCIYEKPAGMSYMPPPISRIVVLVTLLKIRPRIISQVTLLYFNPVAKLVLYSLTIYMPG